MQPKLCRPDEMNTDKAHLLKEQAHSQQFIEYETKGAKQNKGMS